VEEEEEEDACGVEEEEEEDACGVEEEGTMDAWETGEADISGCERTADACARFERMRLS
jgi:hypothetical protein